MAGAKPTGSQAKFSTAGALQKPTPGLVFLVFLASARGALHIRILLNGPQDARSRKVRFAYSESLTKRSHSRESPSAGQNPRVLGRIRSLLAGVCSKKRLNYFCIYINSLYLPPDSENRKFANSALIVQFMPLARKPCLPRHRAPGMGTESTSGGSKERPFFFYLSFVHAFSRTWEKA